MRLILVGFATALLCAGGSAGGWVEWSGGLNAPEERYHSGLATTEDKQNVLVFAGYRYNHRLAATQWFGDLWLYNLRARVWMLQTPVHDSAKPAARYRHSFVALVVGSEMMYAVIGGDGQPPNGDYADLWLYSLKRNRWFQSTCTTCATLPDVRLRKSGHTTVVVNTPERGIEQFVFGGIERAPTDGAQMATNTGLLVQVTMKDPLTSRLDSAEYVYTVTDSIRPVSDLAATSNSWPSSRFGHVAMVCSEKPNVVFIHDGLHLGGLQHHPHDLWSYDVSARQWRKWSSSRGSTPSPRGNHDGVCVNGRLYIFGGCKCAPSCVCNAEMWMYTLSDQSWSLLEDGSRTAAANAAANVFSLDYLFGSTNLSPVPIGRYCHRMTLLDVDRVSGEAKFVLFGGESYRPYSYYNDLWIYTTQNAALEAIKQNGYSMKLAFFIVVTIAAFLGVVVLFHQFCKASVKAPKYE